MLVFKEYDTEKNYRTLSHSPQVFHKALKWVLQGERRFHVKHPYGKDYDLEYHDNDRLRKSYRNEHTPKGFDDVRYFPEYLIYDENDTEKLYLDVFEDYDGVIFEELNEYSVVLAGILLSKTSLPVFVNDERFMDFLPENERMFILGNAPLPELRKPMHVIHDFNAAAFEGKMNRISAYTLFHNVFFLQFLTDLPLGQIKYAELIIDKIEGIGSLLFSYTAFINAFSKYGISVCLKPGSSHFPDEMLKKYFNLKFTPEDSCEDNTIYLVNYICLHCSYFFLRQENTLPLSLISDKFLSELSEYADAVIGNKKMLGVLIRGTDYLTTNMPFVPMPVHKLAPLLRKKMDDYKLEGICLATEDSDVLREMREEFPGKLIAISQKRTSVSEFKDKVFLYEVEKEKAIKEDNLSLTEDTAVNYLYASYLLSRCECFVATPFCNGIALVQAFNEGRFTSTEVVMA